MARYLVTGATGFIGGAVAARLRAAGHDVVAVVREPARADAVARQGVVLMRGDVTDRESLRAPMRGVDGVFHLAGWYKIGSRHPEDGVRINVEGTRNVLAVMREHGIARGVYTSTLAVHGDTHGQVVDESHRFSGPFESVYDRTKWQAHYEVALRESADGLPVVIVQPGLVYGPGDTSSVRTTLRQYLLQQLPLIPARSAYSWGHIDDIADGHILAMERGRVGECYHLAGPVSTLTDALQLVERVSGVPGPRFIAPPWLLRGLSAAVTPLAAWLPEQYHPENLRVMAGCTYLGSAHKAERELGWRARPLEAGLGETVRHEMRDLGMIPPRG